MSLQSLHDFLALGLEANKVGSVGGGLGLFEGGEDAGDGFGQLSFEVEPSEVAFGGDEGDGRLEG
jgi:hypothetical protein